MKTLFDYKKSLVELKEPEKEIEKVFKEICDLLVSWGIDPDSVKVSGIQCNPIYLKDNFNEVFLENFIASSLDIPTGNPLWNSLFKITKTESCNHYGDITTYDMDLESKFNRVKEMSGTWVYENYKQVEDFLNENNPKYIKLVNIKRLFPIQIL